ncbi:MAG: flagellar biosynthetic protein FliO [candidate division KSB1 bacterium]|nr:flagellar biosynthetic protein FliO [candidate division KSB1 bacterium]
MKSKLKQGLAWFILGVIGLAGLVVYTLVDPEVMAGKALVGEPAFAPGYGYGKMLFVLFAILTLMLGFAWLGKKFLNGRFLQSKQQWIQILDSALITPRSRIVVVQALDRILILGVTEQQMSVLAEITDPQTLKRIASGSRTDQQSTFQQYLHRFSH